MAPGGAHRVARRHDSARTLSVLSARGPPGLRQGSCGRRPTCHRRWRPCQLTRSQCWTPKPPQSNPWTRYGLDEGAGVSDDLAGVWVGVETRGFLARTTLRAAPARYTWYDSSSSSPSSRARAAAAVSPSWAAMMLPFIRMCHFRAKPSGSLMPAWVARRIRYWRMLARC